MTQDLRSLRTSYSLKIFNLASTLDFKDLENTVTESICHLWSATDYHSGSRQLNLINSRAGRGEVNGTSVPCPVSECFPGRPLNVIPGCHAFLKATLEFLSGWIRRAHRPAMKSVTMWWSPPGTRTDLAEQKQYTLDKKLGIFDKHSAFYDSFPYI
jgi:hypothetical protein